jgi:hypothetical protein
VLEQGHGELLGGLLVRVGSDCHQGRRAHVHMSDVVQPRLAVSYWSPWHPPQSLAFILMVVASLDEAQCWPGVVRRQSTLLNVGPAREEGRQTGGWLRPFIRGG